MNDIVTNSIIDNYKFVAENWKRMYEEKKEEVERLNNIINELEVFLKEGTELATGCGITKEYIYAYENVLDKLQELKERDKE